MLQACLTNFKAKDSKVIFSGKGIQHLLLLSTLIYCHQFTYIFMTQNSDVSEQQQLDYIQSISKYHTKGIKYNAII